MKIRPVKVSDQEQLFECFKSYQVRARDIPNSPPSGFYEYDLSFESFIERAQSPFSLVLEDNSGRFLSYVVGYDLKHMKQHLTHRDAVHQALANTDDHDVYLDQMLLTKGLPLYLAMRLLDRWDFVTQGEKVPQIFAAIPFLPWRNRSSERTAAHRGFKRTRFVDGGNLTLALFEKPYY